MTAASTITDDELRAALRELQQDPDPRAREWTIVDRWMRAHCPDRGELVRSDAREDALLSVANGLPRLRAESPKATAAWVLRIFRARLIDLRRVQRRERARSSDVDPTTIAAPPEVVGDIAREAIAWVLATVESFVSVEGATERSKHREQARTALLRLVLGYDRVELEDALGARLSSAQVYQWTRRGRALVLRALERWRAAEPSDERTAAIVDVLAEIMRDARADAGVPRSSGRAA